MYDNWKSKGKPSITDNARKLTLKIIKDHKPKQLTKSKQEKLKDIIVKFEAQYR